MEIVKRATETEDGLDVARALALDALRLGRVLRDPLRRPARWSEPGFAVEVERYRRDMARIRTKEDLTAAYARDIFAATGVESHLGPGNPIRVAYALRWLELFEGVTGPSWSSLVT